MKDSYFSKALQIDSKYVIDDVENVIGKILVYCHSRERGMWYENEYSRKVSERRDRKVKHIMVEDQQVFLVIKQRRFRFNKLKTCRWENLHGIANKEQTTEAFKLHTLRELQRDNYSGTGKKRG